MSARRFFLPRGLVVASESTGLEPLPYVYGVNAHRIDAHQLRQVFTRLPGRDGRPSDEIVFFRAAFVAIAFDGQGVGFRCCSLK